MKTLFKNTMLAMAAVGLFIGSASVASADNFKFLDLNMDREVLHPGQSETWRFDLLNDRLVGGVEIDANDIITRAAVAINFFRPRGGVEQPTSFSDAARFELDWSETIDFFARNSEGVGPLLGGGRVVAGNDNGREVLYQGAIRRGQTVVGDVSGLLENNVFSISVNIRNAERSRGPLGVRGVALFGTFEEYTADNGNGTKNPVPEPATMLLFGTGIAGLAGFSRKKMKQ